MSEAAFTLSTAPIGSAQKASAPCSHMALSILRTTLRNFCSDFRKFYKDDVPQNGLSMVRD